MSRLSRWVASWRPMVRIARRDALRAPGRSALIVAMIALPILAMTASDVLMRSSQLDPDEEVARRLGQTQAFVEPSFTPRPVVQAPDPYDGSSEATPSEGASQSPYVDTATLRAAVPPDYRVLTTWSGSVVAETEAGVADTEWSETPVGDPALSGRYVVRDGAAAADRTEVAVTSELFDRLGVPVGATLRLSSPDRSFTLTGVVDQVGEPAAERIWGVPGTLIGDAVAPSALPSLWLVGAQPVTWAAVQGLNERGLLVASRTVLLDPPQRSAVPYHELNPADTGARNDDFWVTVMLLGVVVVLAGLEVCLLAGAAFAVGARRQARTLGLVAAAGGTRRQVRSVVLAGGLVLGAVGGAVGVALGLVLAAVARPVLTSVAHADFGHYDVRPFEVLAIAALGIVTGLLAAVLPARTAARQDPVVALTGRRGQVRTARKVPVIGLAVVVVGIACAALGSSLAVAQLTGLNPLNGRSTALVAGLIGGGAALAQIGLIITSPAIIGLVARWSRRLPLAGRLALRDAARHRGRSAPAMAAVLTAVTGSTALLLFVAAMDARDRETYTPTWPALTGGVELTRTTYDSVTGSETRTRIDPDRVLAAIRPELPPFTAGIVPTLDTGCPGDDLGCVPGYVVLPVPAEQECFLWSLVGQPTEAQLRRAERDPRCQESEQVISGQLAGAPVGGGDVLSLVTRGVRPAAAVEVLERGGVVVFDPRLLGRDGTVTVEVVSSAAAAAAQDADSEPASRRVVLPAAVVPVGSVLAEAVYSAGAAEALGVATAPSTLLLEFDSLPTQDEEEAAAAALAEAGLQLNFSVERGYVSEYGLGQLALVLGAGVITLGAAGIATGLAQADARADHATLAAVGAAPGMRRRLAAAQALSVAGLGTVLGVAAGFVPAIALIGAMPGLQLTVPGWQLAQVLVLIPALAAGSSWLLTRSRMPLERRVG